MPEITDYQIHSFSSEDSNFPAKNLLSTSTAKKWKCGNPEETSSFVILKLTKHSKISAINIGNQGSAFIEILVADSRESGYQFKELILAKSFMNSMESMNQRNINTVKCFPSDSLVDTIKDKEWDLVKIVCKQPFNKKVNYGIAFISLQSPVALKPKKVDENIETTPTGKKTEEKTQRSSEKVKKFGRFTMVMSSSDEDEDDNKSSSFSRWKSSHFSDKKEPSLKRTIETKMSEDRNNKKFKPDDKKNDTKNNSSSSSRHRSKLMYTSEDDEPNQKAEEKIKKDKLKEESSKSSHSHHSKSSSITPKRNEEKSSKNFSSFIDGDHKKKSSESSKKSSPSKEPKSSPKKTEKFKKAKKIEYKQFGELLSGVTFVFSGFVNPERGTLREKALEMGAKYQLDWNDRCTHLICAYSNTPKYQQVKKIAGKKIVTKKWIEACHSEKKRLPWRRFALDKHDKSDSESEPEIHCKSEEVDDEPTVIDEPEAPKILPKVKSFVDLSTDDEEDQQMSSKCENQVFKGKVFYLNSDLSATDAIKLKDQIESMCGKLTKTSRDADYIIAVSERDLPSGDIKGECLKGLWVNEVYELEALIPIHRYKLKTG